MGVFSLFKSDLYVETFCCVNMQGFFSGGRIQRSKLITWPFFEKVKERWHLLLEAQNHFLPNQMSIGF